ncbi:hypothetical protein TH66_05570 [Carbonactinospora thermoautotrophica]|uniref:MIP18 family-like domain-containing protein n=1 Tax=Carbonactinospora thermoautotrophica TaxID=1469144 RepID=A0A132N3G1_9ACTN|nr:iron-sulfur cluster assembly protein [Carbonactinospora thermoautotrophica]KWX00976.1 hypothetical protein LI90_2004 [Carbonactinospora thermoautotrophica]KWX04681.1 hypothetical protein TH66_05570 [Carbonactinospora thermoautotrophica]KWX06878.1 hypothetical protein TR74_20605 [Carbonactinospora thermoautotrophica]
MTDLAAVYAALAQVRDPEVDEPITAMGFVADVASREDGIHVTLRLPTYFCAPNFTYLMMADAQRAVEAVAGRVHVALEGHFESGRLNTALAEHQEFSAAFGDEATGELDEIRDRFRRKAFLVRQERLCRLLEEEGADAQALLTLTIGDLPPSRACEEYLRLRAELGIDCDPGAPFLVAADGTRVRPDRLHIHRRSASVLALSFESNGALCRALLTARYDQPDPVAREGAHT